MSAHTATIIEIVLVDGAALAFGVWQYLSVRPPKKPPAEPPPKSPEGAGHPEG